MAPVYRGPIVKNRFTVWGLVLAAVLGCVSRESTPDSTQSQPSTTGVNDQLILAAAAVALPPPGVAPGDLPSPASEGARHIATFCAACHNLPSPAIHSATDWPGVVRRMWLRMDRLPSTFGVAVPSVQQRQVMLDYLIANALKVSGTNLPQGAGRSTFSQTCSRCHALPDPRQHSAADWPAVVLRMEERMDQMKVDRPSPEATQGILLYLGTVSGNR
jgi:cytochrome c5